MITKRIGHVIYDVEGKKFQCKRHWNQWKPRHTTEVTENTEEIPMEVLYDTMKIPISVSQHSQMDVSPTSRPEVLLKIYPLYPSTQNTYNNKK